MILRSPKLQTCDLIKFKKLRSKMMMRSAARALKVERAAEELKWLEQSRLKMELVCAEEHRSRLKVERVERLAIVERSRMQVDVDSDGDMSSDGFDTSDDDRDGDMSSDENYDPADSDDEGDDDAMI
jgi:hypothetical protein